MTPIKDEIMGPPSLKIIEKYGVFFRYIYPMLINMGGKHRVIRDRTLDQIIFQIGLFNDAAKSNQINKLYFADSGLSTIRDLLRILSDQNIKLLSLKQYGVSTSILAEVGAMLGEWIRKMQKRKVSDG
jgi:hypothetical protein